MGGGVPILWYIPPPIPLLDVATKAYVRSNVINDTHSLSKKVKDLSKYMYIWSLLCYHMFGLFDFRPPGSS